MKQENSHRRRLWFLECLWSWKWLLRGFLWRRREATAHNHNANLSPLFFSSVLPLTWLPNAPKCSRTTWRFATTREEAATITRCSNEHSHFTSLWDYMRLLQITTSTALLSPVCLRLFRSSVSFLLSLRVEMLHALLGDGMSYYLPSIGTGEKCTSIP